MRFDIAYTGQNDHTCLASNGVQPRQEIEAVLAAKIEVEQNDVGLFACRERDGLVAIRSLPSDNQAWPTLDE